MELTEDEVLQILRLLNESNFDQLHLQVGDLNLMVSKNEAIRYIRQEPTTLTPGKSNSDTRLAIDTTEPEITKQISKQEAPGIPSEDVLQEGQLPIKAPMLGTFHSRPEPGSPPYVDVDAFVRPDNTVGLIEVMKLFTPVKAGVQGYISQVWVQSGQLVEYGQILFTVSPDRASDERGAT